jgi:Tetratricopeptide repeat
MAKALGKTHPWTLSTTQALALSYCQHGNVDFARKLLREVVETRKETLGESHPSTVESIEELALWE